MVPISIKLPINKKAKKSPLSRFKRFNKYML
jgi:hypothetical protein